MVELFLKKETEYLSNSIKETNIIAENFAKVIKKGQVVLLIGELGTGKTMFVQALAKSLGVKSIVNSPSFKLINEYQSYLGKINHFDLYRLECIEDIQNIGWDDYIYSDALTIVEWAQRAKNIWPHKEG